MNKIFLLFIFLFFVVSGFSQLPEAEQLRFDENFFEAVRYNLKTDYKKSNEYYEQCLAIKPQSDVVYFKMAQNYFELKDYEKAEFYLNKAKSINDKNKWYHHLYIKIQIARGVAQPEIFKMIEAYKKEAKNKYVIKDLYREFYKNKQQQVQVNYRIKNTQNVDFEQLYKQNQYQKIIEKAEKILEQKPDDSRTYLWIAKAKTALKKYNEAIDYLDMGIDFVMHNKDLKKKYYQLYIEIYKAQGQEHKARKYQEKLQKI